MLIQIDHVDLLRAIESSLRSQAYELAEVTAGSLLHDPVVADAVFRRVANNLAQAVMLAADAHEPTDDSQMWTPKVRS